MRATGIVRRIDDLGRIVIPKEVRKKLHMREGDPLEIFTNKEGNVILRKYSSIEELRKTARIYVETLSQGINQDVLIIDMDIIVAIAGGVKKEMIGKSISLEMESIIQKRESIAAVKSDKHYVKIADNGLEEYGSQIICPILSESEIIGAIVFLGKDATKRMDKTERTIAQFAANFIGRLLEK